MSTRPGEVVATLVGVGPIRGVVVLADGTVVDVTEDWVAVEDTQAAEVAHLVSSRYAAEGHPTDPHFVYEVPSVFSSASGYVPHPDNASLPRPVTRPMTQET